MTKPMTYQSAFSFPDPNTQPETFTSFSPSQTFTSEPITNSQPNHQTSTPFRTCNFNNIILPHSQNGNSKKSLGRDSNGGIIILPPVSFEEHVAVQRETKARTLLLQSLPEDHMADFHHLDDAREIWLDVKARFGGNEESKKMRKTMLKQEFSEFRVSEEEGLHKGYDRALPPSWSQVSLTLKTRGEHKLKEGEQVYGLMAGFKSDFADPAVNAAGNVYDVAAEFALMGISPKAKIKKKEWEVKLIESLARFDKWKASSKNLAKLINSSMTTRTKLGLGFKEYFGSDEVFDLSTPSIFDPEHVTREVKSLYERFVKAGDMHEVPPSITGTFMPTSSNSVLEETQVFSVLTDLGVLSDNRSSRLPVSTALVVYSVTDLVD
nr:xylulose kinase-1 [Tanacetum cinerariifolium]